MNEIAIPNQGMKYYFHLSYSLAITFVVLVVREIVGATQGDVFDFPASLLTPTFLLSLAFGTMLVGAMLYLHLPKMIVRCFNIGRKFGI